VRARFRPMESPIVSKGGYHARPALTIDRRAAESPVGDLLPDRHGEWARRARPEEVIELPRLLAPPQAADEATRRDLAAQGRHCAAA